MTRVFIAAEIPDDIIDKIRDYERELAGTNAKLNIVKPENCHITLKFIGEVTDKKLELIKKRLAEIRYDKYTMKLGSADLNNKRNPRMVWISGSDEGKSAELAALIEDKLAPLGIEKEDRPFKIHITLARIKESDPSLMRAAAHLHEISSPSAGEFNITGLKLKKSTLTPSGPIYEDIMEVQFK